MAPSTKNQEVRFINMNAKQVRRRYKKTKQQEYRKTRLQSKSCRQKGRPRKARPCCGLNSNNCRCKPPPGMRKSYLNDLCRRYSKTALASFQDTTDVSSFQRLMAEHCGQLPLGVLLAYAHTHVVFNQDHLLQSFIQQKAFLFKPPWFDWQKLQSIVQKSKQAGQKTRSSNYRNAFLRRIRLPSHIGKVRLLQSNCDTVERAVLACRIVGEDAMPDACLELYENNPSRDLWKASMLTWLEAVHRKCSGFFNHYYLKCALDRAFAVRTFSTSTISWWPTECPAYRQWYKLLYPERHLTEAEKFQVLCTTYVALNQKKGMCSIPEALAQTCWVKREKNGSLHLSDDV